MQLEQEKRQLHQATAYLTATLAAARADRDQSQAKSEEDLLALQKEITELKAAATVAEENWLSRMAARDAELSDLRSQQQALQGASGQQLADLTKQVEEQRRAVDEGALALKRKAEEAADWKRAADEVHVCVCVGVCVGACACLCVCVWVFVGGWVGG